MLKKIKLFFIILIAFSSILFSQQEEMRIAIFDLQPVGVSEHTAKTVSDILRTELFKTKLFTIIERDQMNTILQEQGFQQSGCTETECAVQMGRLLSAHKVLVGTVNKLGEAFIINARIVDVEKGVMEFGEKAKVASEAELDTGCELFAKKLATMIKGGEVKKEEPKKPAYEEKPESEREYEYPLKTAGYISTGIGIISLGGGLFLNRQVNKNNDTAQELYNEYLNATSDFDTKWNAYKDKVDLVQKQAKIRNALYITSGVTLTFGFVSIFIYKKPVSERISIRTSPNQIDFAYKF